MSLHDELLEQAQHLATREPAQPLQASLRRAVSSAYYALFHLLIHESSILFAPGRELSDLAVRVRRAYSHAEMKQASRGFMFGKDSPSVPAEINAMVPIEGTIKKHPPKLIVVAKAFVQLQDARHDADYDTAKIFSRQDVLTLVGTSRDAFQSWDSIRTHPLARAYLVALLIWNKWDRKHGTG